MPIKISPWMKEMSWNFAYMTKVAKGDKKPVKDRDKRKKSYSRSSRCDSSLFIYRQGSDVSYLLVYVDDIILTASSTSRLQQIISSLHSEFDMTDLKELTYFPGISEVLHSTRLFLSQRQYASQLLEHAHMANCNPSWTPVDTECKLGPKGVRVQDPTLCRSQYLTFTRPVIRSSTRLEEDKVIWSEGVQRELGFHLLMFTEGKRSIRSNVLVKEVDMWIVPKDVGERIKDGIVDLKSDMIEGEPCVYGVGFVTIKLSGKWMAE
ncbi:ribonuclease H-like domain-containing protein, partial [Tanacetum coccineum]